MDQADLAGRQLDGAIGSLEVLPEIVDAVGSQMTVLFDSGIRTGSDIIKALALGAKAVFIGRPVMYGYAINGQEGAKAVLQGLLADLYLGMGLAGLKSVEDCKPDAVRKVQCGGDLKAVL
jgi:isopentenyl diphosphate isomerase/L-lactate dehydrogenase-like FMN-dependent dehydrogenase